MTLQQQQQQQQQQNKKQESKSYAQIEVDNAYLKQQNEHLEKELSFTRYTINVLKNMTNQRDVTLNETRLELERALKHIQILSYTIKQQQRYSSSGMSGLLVTDESSDDLSEEDDNLIYEERPSINIMSKLPLRQQNNQIQIQEY